MIADALKLSVYFGESVTAGLEPSDDALMRALQRRGISTRQGTHAVHLLAYYRHRYGVAAEDFPQSLDADRTSLSLPIFPEMTEQHGHTMRNGMRSPVALRHVWRSDQDRQTRQSTQGIGRHIGMPVERVADDPPRDGARGGSAPHRRPCYPG